MKKFFIMVIFWFVGIITVIIGSGAFKSFQSSEYDTLAVPYINQTIPEISKWDPLTTKALMAPEIAATIPDDKFTRAMEFFSQLGSLQSMEEPDFEEAFIDQETDLGKQTILEYNVDTIYEHGEAEVNLKLLVKGDNFEIYRFNFSSETLLPEQSKQ